MSWGRLLLIGLFVLFYLRSPIDLVPDVIGPVGLLDDLLLLVWFIGLLRRHWEAPPGPSSRPAAPGKAAETDPYKILAVSRGATREEITKAYRDQMKRYHPDRVGDLGEELQALAHEKTIAIQRAYEQLCP